MFLTFAYIYRESTCFVAETVLSVGWMNVLVVTKLAKGGECCAKLISHVWLFETLWTVAHQAPLSMEFSRQKFWSRLPFPSPGDLPDPGIEPVSHAFPSLAGRLFTTAPPDWDSNFHLVSSLTPFHLLYKICSDEWGRIWPPQHCVVY